MSNKPEPCCPLCKKGVRVEAIYTQGGLPHDGSYCGFCGKNWPKTQLKIVRNG